MSFTEASISEEPKCGSSARWDLCGGSQVTGCPTVTTYGVWGVLNWMVALGITIDRRLKGRFRKGES